MDENSGAVPLPPAQAALASPAPPETLSRFAAGLQVFLICGIPTQILVTVVLAFGFHVPMMTDAGLSLSFVAGVALLDTALVAVLIRVFLSLSGETSARVFVGTKPIGGEILRGLVLLPVVFLVVAGIVLGLRSVAPWLHNVEKNPLEAFMHDPVDAAVFIVVAVIGGGVREELQRAFILHRFAQRLGGVGVGLAVFSVLFAALHFEQGLDAAVAVGLLGLFWGIVYIKRGSAMLPMANHASFNAVQVLQSVFARSFGG